MDLVKSLLEDGEGVSDGGASCLRPQPGRRNVTLSLISSRTLEHPGMEDRGARRALRFDSKLTESMLALDQPAPGWPGIQHVAEASLNSWDYGID